MKNGRDAIWVTRVVDQKSNWFIIEVDNQGEAQHLFNGLEKVA